MVIPVLESLSLLSEVLAHESRRPNISLKDHAVTRRFKKPLHVPDRPRLLSLLSAEIGGNAACGCRRVPHVAAAELDILVCVLQHLQGFGGPTKGDQADGKVALPIDGTVLKIELLQDSRLLLFQKGV